MSDQRPRVGRPPRTDKPVRIGLMLPGALYKWLRRRARVEKRPQGDVMASALTLYRRHFARGGKL